MNDTKHHTGRLALQLARYVTSGTVGDQLLSISQEAPHVWDVWGTPGINLADGSPQAAKLAKGNATQACAVAAASRDSNLLLRMAKRERRRSVRAELSFNRHLPDEAAELLWEKEQADAAATGADINVVTELLKRMPADKAAERYLQALGFGYNQSSRNVDGPLTVTVSSLLAADGGGATVLRLLETLIERGRNPATTLIEQHTRAVFFGHTGPDMPVEKWCRIMQHHPVDWVTETAASAAWYAALVNPDVTGNPNWLPLALNAWRSSESETNRNRRQRAGDGVWRELLAGNERSHALVAALSEDDATRMAENANPAMIDILVEHARALPQAAWEALVERNAHQTVVREHHAALIRAAVGVDQVKLMMTVAAPNFGSDRTIETAWAAILDEQALPFDLVVTIARRSPGRLVPACATGANALDTPEKWDKIAPYASGDAVDTIAANVAGRLLDHWQRANNPAMVDHLWRTTPKLAVATCTNGGESVIEITAAKLRDALEDDPNAWDTALRLWPEWYGTLEDLCDVTKTL